MWNIIAAIASAIIGLGGSGTSGVSSSGTGTSNTITNTFTKTACYSPEPDVNLTLKWPLNFTNVPDYRSILNPDKFKNTPSTFDTQTNCQPMVMNSLNERRFIRVRKDLRISSCKTDELAGPFAGTGGKSGCPGNITSNGARQGRGSCSLDGYPDLRKVAETKNADGRPLEIFWNPFSHNVGCNYKEDTANCGAGQRRNINLKDFIYVLKKRDAFDPQTHPGCPILWDAGSTNAEACSHYFDVYIAEDFYLETKSAPATNDPENKYYFVKQVLENCQEQQQYIPVAEANLTMPPLWIKTPFISQSQSPAAYSTDKILPSTDIEKANYLMYVWGRGDLMNPFTTNLLKFSENSGALNICQSAKPLSAGNLIAFSAPSLLPLGNSSVAPTLPPLSDCYDPLGTIYIKDDKGKTQGFQTYSKLTAPQTFTLVKTDAPDKLYQYTLTEKNYPSNLQHDSSLQLRVMKMANINQWTWGTPQCKPAIYMYPEKPTDINVKLNLDGKLTVSNPNYDADSGWNVTAYPDGRIKVNTPRGWQAEAPAEAMTPPTVEESEKTYPYLYYEAELNGVTLPKEGFVYSRQELPKQLRLLMEKIGFNGKETSDFLEYWLPRLTEKPYYFVTLLPQDLINSKEKLTFTVNPDTLIRTRFVFEGLDAPVSVRPLTTLRSDPVPRTGFTVTDWGGTLVGKSCSDVVMK